MTGRQKTIPMMFHSSRESFEKITQSVMFQSGEGSEQIQKTLRYNVHKNLGECYVEEESWEQAEDQFFLATQIDRTDVTLWWQLGQSHTPNMFLVLQKSPSEGS